MGLIHEKRDQKISRYYTFKSLYWRQGNKQIVAHMEGRRAGYPLLVLARFQYAGLARFQYAGLARFQYAGLAHVGKTPNTSHRIYKGIREEIIF